MIKKVTTIIYSLIVLAFAVASSLISWANDTSTIFMMELIVDIIIISGILLSLSDKRLQWWIVLLIIAIVGEIYLLSIDPRSGLKESFQWSIILLPALYLNLQVTGLLKTNSLVKNRGYNN